MATTDSGAVLVTGGAGRLARALFANGRGRVFPLSRRDLDVRDFSAVASQLQRLRPSAVINAAVVSDVETAQAGLAHAHAVNAVAPGLLVRACAKAGVPVIHLSTDYVYGAATDRPWREDDPTSPVNGYGRTKAAGEAAALAAEGATVCVARVAWLFGDGQDFPSRMLELGRSRGSVTVAADQIGSPTPLAPLARRLLAVADRMVAGEPTPPILHLAGSPPVSRADWVEAAFDAFTAIGGVPPRIERARLDSFADQAPRPAFSALDCSLAAELLGGPIDWRAAIPGLAELWMAERE